MDRKTIQRWIAEIQLALYSASDDDRRYLERAVADLQPLLRPPAEREEYAGIPRHLVLEMFETGRDPWISELTGRSIGSVRLKRRALGIDPFGRGGDPAVHEAAMKHWLSKWRPRLEAAGWQPPQKHAG